MIEGDCADAPLIIVEENFTAARVIKLPRSATATAGHSNWRLTDEAGRLNWR